MARGTIDTLEKRLLDYGVDTVEDVIDYLKNNIKAFEYVKKSVNDFSIFVVLKNVGKDIIFKTVRGVVICDKLDVAYSNSRELIGLEYWNVKRVVKINIIDSTTFNIKLLHFRDIQRIVFNAVDPSSIDYVICYEDKCMKFSVADDILKGMSFETLIQSVDTVLTNKSLPRLDVASKHLNCFVVDFYKEEYYEYSS